MSDSEEDIQQTQEWYDSDEVEEEEEEAPVKEKEPVHPTLQVVKEFVKYKRQSKKDALKRVEAAKEEIRREKAAALEKKATKKVAEKSGKRR